MDGNQRILNTDIITELRDMGDDFFAEIIEKFYEDADQDLGDIQRYAVEGNASDLGIAAHGLKGTSLTMGAHLLAGIALEVELKGKGNDLTDMPEYIERLQDAYRKTREALDHLLHGE
jgi:HPt (histidine-containing phosphotransfer) domain-containing protein